MEEKSDFEETSEVYSSRPNAEQRYNMDNLLTIDNENGARTLRVSQWLIDDPVAFDKTRKEHHLKINPEVFNILVSKLRANHPEYFKEALGLNVRIRFKGYDIPVKAIVPYKDHPVEFYKWWCANQDLVNISLAEKIRLFDNVWKQNQNTLKSEHKKMIHKK